MATINEAIYTFFNSFSVTAYEENTVPSGAVYPYISYNVPIGYLNDKMVGNCNVWSRSSSWSECVTISDKIATAIGRGGKYIPFTGGAIWIKRGSPFMQRMGDTTDSSIRRMYIQLEIEIIGE